MEEEMVMYDFKDFIGDFGGYLGLFLGGSILSLFEMLDKFIEKFKTRKIENNTRKKSMIVVQPSELDFE